ncbi:intermembrane transport protein PqiB [Sinimarinibacterium thermocellulolyticum]|uniref:MlaD family protein n=1 Tax=Sinimarinibacterium thermocellulolyticum TaxID=3170016 RepID=A0ABV2A886_9GAMM
MSASDSPTDFDSTHLPTPEIRRHRRGIPSLVWLVPIVAALIGIALVIRAVLSAGIMLEITFKSAEGLKAGQTELRYKDVVVGMVRSIALSEDLQSVIVSVELDRHASRLAVEDSRFWVVRPRIDTGGISGLGTLVSGVYIAVDVGKSAQPRTEFTGLETAPAVTNDSVGTSFVLRSASLGSLGVGSPVYFRRIQVGRVGAYQLNEDGRGVTLQVFVDAPYDRFVTADTRFWNASGVDLSLGASGLRVNTESLAAVLAGGVAFESPRDGDPAPGGTEYWLHDDRTSALAPPSGRPVRVRMRFAESIRGLAIGAPVDFHGVEFGTVESLELEYDADGRTLVGNVVARLFPKRLGRGYDSLRAAAGGGERSDADVLAALVGDGLQAQLRSGNLLTGQLYVELDFARRPPGKVPAPIVTADGMIEIPTARGSLAQLQDQIASIVEQLGKVPFEDLGNNLRDAIASADALLTRLEGELAPEATRLLTEAQRAIAHANRALLADDSGLQQDLRQSLQEVERAGRSLRGLADYLQRHPDALIRGRRSSDEEPRSATEEQP